MTVELEHQKTVRMELEDCCRVDIHDNSPLTSSTFVSRFGTVRLGHYPWHVDSYIFLLFSYSFRFFFVRSCEIWVVFFLCSYFYWERTVPNWKKKFDPLTKKNGCKFQIFYIPPCSAVDSVQWDLGINGVIELGSPWIHYIFSYIINKFLFIWGSQLPIFYGGGGEILAITIKNTDMDQIRDHSENIAGWWRLWNLGSQQPRIFCFLNGPY